MDGTTSASSPRTTIIATVIFALLSVHFGVLTLRYAAAAPLWMDEVLALWTAQRPDALTIWHALEQGAEFTPPAYDLGLHVLVRLGFDTPLALRLPSIIAVYGAALAIGMLVLRRAGPPPAMVAAGAMLSSGLVAFAVQARPYAFVTLAFCAALAVYVPAPGRSPTRARAVLSGAFLTLAVALHFYALLLVVAFAALELVRAHADRRRPHAPTLLAAGVAATSIVLWWPIMAAARAMSGNDVGAPAYYARPTLPLLLDSYAITLGWLAIPMAVLVLLRRRVPDRGLLDPALVLLAIPLWVFVFAALVSHSYAWRYVISAAAGAGLLLAALVQRLPGWAAPTLLALFLAGNLWGDRGVAAGPDRRSAVSTAAAAPGDLPIVTGSGLRWFELVANASPALRRRLVFLDTRDAHASPDPTNYHQVMRWKVIDPRLRVVDAAQFLCDTPTFWLFVDPAGGTDPLPHWLRTRAAFATPDPHRPSLVRVRSVRCT